MRPWNDRSRGLKPRPGLLRDVRGMSTVEYVIALCLVGAVSVGVWAKFGNTVATRLAQTNVLLRDHLRVGGKPPRDQPTSDGDP